MPSPAIWAGCAPRQRVGLDAAPALGAAAVGDAVKQEPAHLWEMLPDTEEARVLLEEGFPCKILSLLE